ncbi:flagellar assembly protein FliW [Ornithinibacillus sp. L9]|uniref:Flagellar assembly factor FliW n=1 Tax=Ornithinibacillus caprae TaxID=2678566 RepID=A0A6N8FNJ7_9BACI|nr:flagellar assembly protein FliW [Ornithinibacillus caprae]MUK90801.1 flagellar assembly protein FliW [Ornithinibacillus caprae]
MKIETKYLGEVEIEENIIIEFPSGLPGFVDETKFVLLDLPGNPIFQVLQSVRSVNVAFIVTNPYHFYRDYTFELDGNLLEALHIRVEKEVMVLSIITLKEPFHTSTINLKAPVIINQTKMFGKQYILNMEDYPSKASITPTSPSTVKGE